MGTAARITWSTAGPGAAVLGLPAGTSASRDGRSPLQLRGTRGLAVALAIAGPALILCALSTWASAASPSRGVEGRAVSEASSAPPWATAPASAAATTPAEVAVPRSRRAPLDFDVVARTSTPGATPAVRTAPVAQTYAKNLYAASLVRYQNPDLTACTATSTLMMLNFIAAAGSGGEGFRWAATTSYDVQAEILAFERAHMTMLESSPGSDAHGWRNALNHFGWDDYATEANFHYQDFSYGSYEEAAKAAVAAMARYDKPVAILGSAGGHAQLLNGYETFGLDPATSSEFAVTAVYLTDPLEKDALRNARLTDAQFGSGERTYRFRAYEWTDSPADDPFTSGDIPARDEWFGKWVIVAPVQ